MKMLSANESESEEVEHRSGGIGFTQPASLLNGFPSDSSPPRRRRLPQSRRYQLPSLSAVVGILLCFSLLVEPGFASDTADSDTGEIPDFSKVPTPPSFNHKANDPIVYFVSSQHYSSKSNENGDQLKRAHLACAASGYPKPEYKWTKDGQPLDTDESDFSRITIGPADGTLVINNMMKEDAGLYQCSAFNGNGTAVDTIVNLTMTHTGFFTQLTPKVESVELGDSFTKQCVPPESEPDVKVFWLLKNDMKDPKDIVQPKFNTINETHITVDDRGFIYFSYVTEADIKHPSLYYTCAAVNGITKDYKFGFAFGFDVKKTKRPQMSGYIKPKDLYTNAGHHVVLRNSSFTFFCIYSGYPQKTFTPIWEKVDGELPSDRINFENNFNKSLKIESIQFEDEGTYTCSIPDQNIKKQFSLKVEAAPYFEKWPSNRNSSEDESVEFVCGASGIPTPTFSFFKNGKALESDGSHIIIEGNKLTIKGLRKSAEEGGDDGDNGVYQCNATNIHGFVWANFYLNILAFKPYILETPGAIRKVKGDKATLECKVFGSPDPHVVWSRVEGDSTANLDAKAEEAFADGKATLVLPQLDKDQEGTYRCVATNKYGTAQAEGSLVVKNATVILDVPVAPDNVVSGDKVIFHCSAAHDRDLRVSYTWYFNGNPLDVNDKRFDIRPDFTLVVQAEKDLTGDFTCKAATELDEREHTAKLIVKDVPKSPFGVHAICDGDKKTAKVLWEFFDDQLETAPVEGFLIQFNTAAEENSWETHYAGSGSQAVSADLSHREVNLALRPWNQYQFRAIARNEIGDSAPSAPTAKNSCAISEGVPTYNPRNVVVKSGTPEDLTVYWEPMPEKDWNGYGFFYKVQYKEKDGEDPEWKTKNVTEPHADHVTITEGINGPYKEYQVKVAAQNNLGSSATVPKTIEGHSGEGVPDVAPSGFKLKKADYGTVAEFEWDKITPEQAKGNFLGYKIVHWVEDKKRSESTKREAYFDPSVTTGTVYDLQPFRDNSATIEVVNGAHSGPPSDKIVFRMPEGVPTAVRNLRAFPLSHNVTGLMWEGPLEVNGNLCGYKIRWIRLEQGEDRLTVTSDLFEAVIRSTDVKHYRISPLQPETSYRISVSAMTRNCDDSGLGEPNSIDSKSLPESINKELVPEIPKVMVAGSVGERDANLTWIPGQYNPTTNQPVGEQFYFRYRPQGKDEPWREAHPVEGNFTVNIANLEPGTAYEVQSVSISESEAGKQQSTPSDTVIITTAGEGSRAASIAWLIAILVAIIILIIILIIVCLIVRNRGAKYPVQEKERAQGREPMLPEERGFGEYTKPSTDEEKRSLTGASVPESETDSMNDYADGETGKFTEDGSFIGQYGAPNKTFVKEDAPHSNLSTFV